MTDTVIVRFEGDGSGVAKLSWGQHEIWCVIRDKSDSLPIGGVRALPPGQTVAAVAAGLRFIMSRHQSLRTRLRLASGGLPQPAGYRASRTLAARLGVSTSPVLLAAYAVALSPLTSSQSVAVQLVVNNRFRPGFGGWVSTLARSCPCLNDVPADKVFLYINDTPDALCYELRADSHFVSPADMAALMRRIEAVLVDAAVGDTAFEGAALGDTAEGGTRAVPAMGAVR